MNDTVTVDLAPKVVISTPYHERSVAALADYLPSSLGLTLVRSGSNASRAISFCSRGLGKLGLHKYSSRLMWFGKLVFDRSVAQRVQKVRPAVVIGMWGSSRRTFRVAKDSGALCVLNFVNAHPVTHNASLRPFTLNKWHQEIIPRVMTNQVKNELILADLILVPSRLVADDLVLKGIEPNRIIISPYGVDTTKFQDARSRTPSAASRTQVIYVGQLSYRKGLTVLIDVAKRSRDIDFLLVGPMVSPEVLRDRPSNVTVLGSVPWTRLEHLFSTSDLFVFPTCEDTFGLVVLEAMASGLPVITTSAAGASELVDSSCGWVVEPHNSERLHDALLNATSDLAALSQKSAQCRLQAQRYTWKRFASQVDAAIRHKMK